MKIEQGKIIESDAKHHTPSKKSCFFFLGAGLAHFTWAGSSRVCISPAHECRFFIFFFLSAFFSGLEGHGTILAPSNSCLNKRPRWICSDWRLLQSAKRHTGKTPVSLPNMCVHWYSVCVASVLDGRWCVHQWSNGVYHESVFTLHFALFSVYLSHLKLKVCIVLLLILLIGLINIFFVLDFIITVKI